MDITETENLNNSLAAPSLDPQFLLVANEYLAGKSYDQISETTKLSVDNIVAICNKNEVKSYINSVYLSQGYLHRMKRLSLISRVIEDKVEEALETGVYSKKDLLEWLKLLNDMENSAIKSQESGPKTAIQVNKNTTNNYSQLMKDLLSTDAEEAEIIE